MINMIRRVRPRTYTQVAALSGCMQLRRYVSSLSDDDLVDIYSHLIDDPKNRINVSGGTLSFLDAEDQEIKAFGVTPGVLGFDRILIADTFFRAFTASSDSDSSGCGCSCNNNNNNNNNNNS